MVYTIQIENTKITTMLHSVLSAQQFLSPCSSSVSYFCLPYHLHLSDLSTSVKNVLGSRDIWPSWTSSDFFGLKWCSISKFVRLKIIGAVWIVMMVWFKGQLNSELIYKVIVSPKMPTKNLKDFCPGSLLEVRAEILKIFGWHFGRNDDLINSFWI